MSGVRKYYIDLVEGRRSSTLGNILKFCLAVLSWVYGLIIFLRNFLYDHKFILNQRQCQVPVISIGNLTWSGTGKTSLAITLSKMLSSKNVAVLTRGYGKDEVELLKRELRNSGAEIFAGKDRLNIVSENAKFFDVAVLDDGFQYRRLKRDLDIVLINGNNPFGNGSLLPAGILREPKANIKRADVVIVMHAINRELEQWLKTVNPGIEVFYGYYKVKGLFDFEGKMFDKDTLINKPLACFCAIGYPEGFIEALNNFGLMPILKFIYPDHYVLREKEFRKIEEECANLGIKYLIITSKDKSRFTFTTYLSIVTLEVSLEIERLDSFLTAVKRCIG